MTSKTHQLKPYYVSIAALTASFVLISCGDGTIDHGIPSALKTMLISSATIDTPSYVTLLSDRLELSAGATSTWGCTYTPSGSNSANTATAYDYLEAFESDQYGHANLFTAPSYMKVRDVTLRLFRNGGAAGNMYAELRTAAGLNPATGTALATSNTKSIGSDIADVGGAGDPSGNEVTFTFPTPVEISSGTTYAIVLRPSSGASVNAVNYIGWVITDPSVAAGCSSFATYRFSTNVSGGWSAGNPGGSFGRSFFKVVADTHATSGQVSWIVEGSPAASWKMSTFTFTENVGGLTSGTITYDVGSGSSAASPTYTNTGLTLAQVQALADKTGQYLYVRANLAVSAPAYDSASIGSGSIQNE